MPHIIGDALERTAIALIPDRYAHWRGPALAASRYARNAMAADDERNLQVERYQHRLVRAAGNRALGASAVVRYNPVQQTYRPVQQRKISMQRYGQSVQRRKGMFGQGSRRNWQHMRNCVEFKVKDNRQQGATATNTGLIQSVIGGTAGGGTGITQGNGYNDRVGRKLFLSRLMIHGDLRGSTDASASGCQEVTVLIVVDRQSNATTPTLAMVMNTTTSAGNAQAFANLENVSRFGVLYKRTFVISKDPGSSDFCKRWQFIKRWPKGLHVTYDAGTTDGEDDTIITNNVWVFAYGSDSTSDQNPHVSWTSRIRYTD